MKNNITFFIIVIFVYLAGMYSGYKLQQLKYYNTLLEKEKEILETKRKCKGYTVLSYDKVIMCNGDTVNYKWQPKI